MTALPHEPSDVNSRVPDKNLRAIRAALTIPQDRQAFDAGLKAVLDEVRVSLDLAVLNEFVHRWWIMAADAIKDPEGRRQMYATVERIEATGQVPPGRTLREVLAERGVQV